MPIRTPDGYLDITNATLRGSEIITTSNVGIANSAPTHTLSVGNKLFVDDSAANVLTVSGNLVATSLKIGQIDLAPSYGLEHVSNVGNTISNVVQFTNTGTGFVSASNVGIGTTTTPAGLLDVVGTFRMRYQDMGVTKAHIITGANSTSLTESGGTYTYTRAGSSTTGNFLPNPSNIVPKVGQRYRVKLTARSDYAGTIRYECPTSTIITTYDLTASFKEYIWDFTATGTTMQFAVTTASGTTSQFNAFSIERLGVGFNVNPTSTTAPVQISGVTHFSDNVGVGATPTGKFQVNISNASVETTAWDNTKVVFGDISTGNSQGLGFGVVTNSHASIISLAPGVAWRGLSYWGSFHKWYGGGTHRMTLDSSGKLGIGIASPAATLDIRGPNHDPSTPTVHIGDNSADAGDYGMVNLVRHATSGGSKAHLAFIRNGNTVVCMGFHNNTNTWGIFPSFSSVTSTPALAIASDGKVGIGTNAPLSTLQVGDGDTTVSSGGASGSISLAGTGATKSNGNKPGLYHRSNVGLGVWSDAHMSFEVNGHNGNQTEAMRILTTGLVGIGTATPRWGLESTPTGGLGGILSCSDSPIFSHNLYYSGGWKYGTASTGGAYMRMIDSEIQFWNAPNSGSGTWDTAGGAATTAQRMTIDESGNIGIGTNNPVGKLDVWDGASNGSNIQQNAFFYLRNPANAATNYGAVIVFENTNGAAGGRHSLGRIAALRENNAGNYSSYLQFSPTNNGTEFEAMRLTSGGWVGIGTNDPHARLHVGPQDYNHIYIASSNNSYGWKLDTTDDGGGYVPFRIIRRTGGSDSTALTIRNQDGKVGIGTNDPKSALHVTAPVDYNNNNTPGVEMGVHNSTYAAIELTAQASHQSWIDFKTVNNNSDYKDRILAGTGHMQLYTNNAERMRIMSDGKVGIGTNYPDQKLEVWGNIQASTHGNEAFFFESRGTVRMSWYSGGWLGSGLHFTSAAIWPTDLNGTYSNAGINFGSSSYRWGTIYSWNSLNTASDDRLKHNEAEVADALGAINKLKLLKYDKTSQMLDADYTGDLTDILHIKEVGFIAQDVLEIPELSFLVSVPGDPEEEIKPGVKRGEGTYGLDYQGIHNILVQAVQELSTKNDALETKTTALETKTTALETKLQEAEAKITTLQAEKEAMRSDLSSLVLRVTALES